jgi:hypothetical protein
MADGGLPGRGSRTKAVYQIYIGGIGDVSAKFSPYLISVETNEKFGSQSTGTCSIELDDSYAQLSLPPLGAQITISLGWMSGGINVVWTGVVSEVESGCARKGGGRRLWVDGTSLNLRDEIKSRAQYSMGEGYPPDGGGQDIPFSTFAQAVATLGGIALQVSPSMAAIKRKYWHCNESPGHCLTRYARELGGVFQGVGGNAAVMVSLTDGMNVLGAAMGSVKAVWGDNLISWRVKPILAKPQFGMTAGEFFDSNAGSWIMKFLGMGGVVPFGFSKAQGWSPNANPDEPVTDQNNTGTGNNSTDDRSAGWVLIQGNPQARAGGVCIIEGARPGVDGPWMMSEVEHIYSRDSGYVTRVILSQFGAPGGGNVPTPPSGQGWGESY